MIAEISAVVGILKALNDGIATVKESGDHLSGLSGLFTSLTDSKVAVESIEEATKAGDHVLTQEEALELAWAGCTRCGDPDRSHWGSGSSSPSLLYKRPDRRYCPSV